MDVFWVRPARYPQCDLPAAVRLRPAPDPSVSSQSQLMAGRPVVRTVTLNPDSLELFREVFGSSGHAYKHIGSGMTYSVFRRAWDGKQVTPQILELIEGSWVSYTEGLIERLRRPFPNYAPVRVIPTAA